jgi:hypothetical protein
MDCSLTSTGGISSASFTVSSHSQDLQGVTCRSLVLDLLQELFVRITASANG